MTAEDIAKVPGGRRAGASWLARCPAHNDREPGLSSVRPKTARCRPAAMLAASRRG